MIKDRKRAKRVLRNRVLCVTSSLPRWEGDSTTSFVLNLAQDLREFGWDMDILAPHADQGTASCESMKGVSIERFCYLWPKRAQTVCYHGGALVNLRQNRLNTLKLPFLVAAEWAAILRRLATGRYDLLHSHWILPQGFTSVLAAGPLRIPHVLTVHGSDVFALNGRLLDSFKRFSLRHADAVTVNSTPTRTEVEKLASGLPHVVHIPMGVSTQVFSKNDPNVTAIRRNYRRGTGPLLIFTGRVVEEKGIEDLLNAISLLRRTRPDTTALIVGEGQDRERFTNTANDLGLGDHVTFTGWIQPEKIPTYLAAGDIYVGPSWFEAQGLALIEAMIAGIPVVATRAGGIIDSVEDRETGLLVEKHTPEQIATAVEQLIEDPALCSHLVSTGYEKANEKFSRNASAHAFSSLFFDLLRRRASSAS